MSLFSHIFTNVIHRISRKRNYYRTEKKYTYLLNNVFSADVIGNVPFSGGACVPTELHDDPGDVGASQYQDMLSFIDVRLHNFFPDLSFVVKGWHLLISLFS